MSNPSLHEELAVAIAEAHGGADAGEIARKVLQLEDHSRLLVGVLKDRPIAYVYQRIMWGLVEYPLDELDEIFSSRQVDQIRSVPQLESVIQEREEVNWAWLHPR